MNVELLIPIYQPGNSLAHRLSAARKLLLLLFSGSALLLVTDLALSGVILLLVMAAYSLCGARLTQPLRYLLAWKWLFLIIALVQWLAESWESALIVVFRMATLMLMAFLVTLTTPSTELTAVIVRLFKPLRRFGFPAERIGLMISMVLRYIPLLVMQYQELREAHLARGIKPGIIALLLPLLVRSLRMADTLAEAIDARGYEPSWCQPDALPLNDVNGMNKDS